MSAVSFAILMIAIVALLGLLLGAARVRGIGLGAAGVLFVGILAGHFVEQRGFALNHEMLHFAKEFGLLLFVFTMGIELGPGIVRLMRRNGLRLNALAATIVILGVAVVLASGWILGLPAISTAGLFCGATTNTPALAAAEQAASMVNAASSEGDTWVEDLTATYAVAYPGGVLGIIIAMLLVRRFFAIDIASEASELSAQESAETEPLERRSVLIDNPHVEGMEFGSLAGVEEAGVRVSRLLRAGDELVVAASERTALHVGDVIQVIGSRGGLDRFTPMIGSVSDADLMRRTGNVVMRRISVTRSEVLNRTLRELALDQLFNTTITRIERTGVEMVARGSSQLHFGDVVYVVGDGPGVEQTAKLLGNSGKSLQQTPFIPLFIGVTVGIALGSIPFSIPGMSSAVRLGLAGGPLLAGILLSLIGSIGRLVWYIPTPANQALRQLGMILFLACAGLAAGPQFFALALSIAGLKWIVAGLCVTLLPLLAVGCMARWWLRENYCTLCGVLAGSMTDPPALSFATSLTSSEACSKAYAAVYPLTMVLRIVAAQMLVFLA
ncbi:MAG: putative transporter [Planctomycetales bacterium]|nr:putative transporter [Planctomycetales bacterium]